MQKNSKIYEQQITNIVKTEISETIKVFTNYLNIRFFISISVCNISAKIILND